MRSAAAEQRGRRCGGRWPDDHMTESEVWRQTKKREEKAQKLSSKAVEKVKIFNLGRNQIG
ncbi:hypothetical protein SESBI_28995 [Sesbania bispinosa]|nr:hypothetical protein SESBI_28995 [Sesbania bispinosa]